MTQPNQPAQVQEKAQKPQGLLPKNVQSWLLIGLAFLMVAIMWLTGGKKPQTPAKTASPATLVQAPLEVNENKIAEMQNRIQDLQRQQLVAQTALTQQTRLLGASPQDSQQYQQQSASGSRRFFLKNTERTLSHLDKQFNVSHADMPAPVNEEDFN